MHLLSIYLSTLFLLYIGCFRFYKRSTGILLTVRTVLDSFVYFIDCFSSSNLRRCNRLSYMSVPISLYKEGRLFHLVVPHDLGIEEVNFINIVF